MKEIIFVLPSLNAGGAERVSISILNYLPVQKFTKHLVLINDRGKLNSLISKKITIHNLKQAKLRNGIWALIKKINDIEPDIVFSTLPHVNLSLLICRFFLPKRTKIFIREPNTPSFSIKHQPFPKLFSIAYRVFYRKADKIFCPSKLIKNELEKDFWISEKKIFNLSNPVDIQGIRNTFKKINRKTEWEKIFIASGRLVVQKGFDRLIDLFQETPPNYHLLILGEGPEKEKLEALVKDLNLGNKISFLGHQKNPWIYYANADAVLISSRWEGMPNVVLEALACGAVVISTPTAGGIQEIEAGKSKKVKIANMKLPFLKEIKKVKPKIIKRIRKSNLPKKFHMNIACEEYKKLFSL